MFDIMDDSYSVFSIVNGYWCVYFFSCDDGFERILKLVLCFFRILA